MNIVIIAPYYYPIPVPRAFRATELAQEFVRRGHNVTVYNLCRISDQPHFSDKEDDSNPKLIHLNLIDYGKSDHGTGKRKLSAFLRSPGLNKILFYFTSNTGLSIYLGLKRKFVFTRQYDLLISVGLPFAVHWAVSSKLRKDKTANICIADYGDPFSRYNKKIHVAKYFQWIEKRAMKAFDYISIPTESARKSYLWLKPDKNIKIIPQGFNFDNINRAEYRPNQIPTFGYAGLFYQGIREPKVLLDYLSTRKEDFRFVIYTNTAALESMSCILPYAELLKEKLVIHNNIPRLELITEFSKMDFLVNINNATSNQIPSKLIDYTLTGRPIFSFSQDKFEIEKFESFCHGDYSSFQTIDISAYNIKTVADQFEHLSSANQ